MSRSAPWSRSVSPARSGSRTTPTPERSPNGSTGRGKRFNRSSSSPSAPDSGGCDLAGECGHIRLAPFGPVGFGKAGSFEGFCSGGGIAQLAAVRAKEALQRGEKVPWCPTQADLPNITAKTVGIAADEGDPLARAIYSECGSWLGRGLALLVDLLNPERIVIGSIFARSETWIRPAMEESLRSEAIPAAAAHCRVVPAQLGEKIGDYAALALATGEY